MKIVVAGQKVKDGERERRKSEKRKGGEKGG